MFNNFNDIILNRRTCRLFTPEKPSKEQVSSILAAGLYAPYAALALKDGQKFRQFIVVDGSSEKMEKIRSLVRKQTKKFSKIIPFINFLSPGKISKAFQERLNQDLLGAAPYYVFVVEPCGFPSASKQSISHCLENMWLKATEIGLGFRLISVFETMNKNKELLNILSLGKGKYSVNCCALGYSAYQPEISKRPGVEEITFWLE